MAQKSKPRTPQRSSYRSFEGVDLKKTHSGDESIAFIDNFRITDDGSLKKRYGFKTVYSDKRESTELRASHSIRENGNDVCYFILGSYVKKYSFATQSVINVGEISDTSTHAFFFEYLDCLFLCDGESIFKVDSTSLSSASFYIPLYGTNWNAFMGEKKEAPNLLWPKIAVTYKLTPPSTSYLSLGDISLDSIDALYRNGVLLDKSQYSIHEGYHSITVPEFADDDVFLAILTFVPDENYQKQRNSLLSASNTSLFYELDKNNLFFWGSESDNRIYYSVNVDKDSADVTLLHPKNNGFYVPINSFFTVASLNDRIRAFIRHYDRVLIMTDSATWITDLRDLENGNLKIKNINSSIGCEVKNGCVRIENTIFSIGKDAIYAWTSDTDELNECNAYSISEPIRELLGKDFFKNCLIHLSYGKREIWFSNPASGQIWIYNYNRKVWYSFSGFLPTAFLDGADEVHFYEGSSLHAFDSSLNYDMNKSGKCEIIGRLKSGELEFNSKHKKKLCSATVRGSFNGGVLLLNVLLDSERSLSYDISPNSPHSVIKFRTKSGSFTSLTFELIANGYGDQLIHGIELDAD